MLQNGGKGNWYFAEAVFRGSKGMFRAPARPTFAPGGKSLLRFPKFLRCLTAVGTFSFLSPTAHFSQQLEKWAKEPEETKGFFTSFRAILSSYLIPYTTRSRNKVVVVPYDELTFFLRRWHQQGWHTAEEVAAGERRGPKNGGKPDGGKTDWMDEYL